jgi:hypothetical protein
MPFLGRVHKTVKNNRTAYPAPRLPSGSTPPPAPHHTTGSTTSYVKLHSAHKELPSIYMANSKYFLSEDIHTKIPEKLYTQISHAITSVNKLNEDQEELNKSIRLASGYIFAAQQGIKEYKSMGNAYSASVNHKQNISQELEESINAMSSNLAFMIASSRSTVLPATSGLPATSVLPSRLPGLPVRIEMPATSRFQLGKAPGDGNCFYYSVFLAAQERPHVLDSMNRILGLNMKIPYTQGTFTTAVRHYLSTSLTYIRILEEIYDAILQDLELLKVIEDPGQAIGFFISRELVFNDTHWQALNIKKQYDHTGRRIIYINNRDNTPFASIDVTDDGYDNLRRIPNLFEYITTIIPTRQQFIHTMKQNVLRNTTWASDPEVNAITQDLYDPGDGIVLKHDTLELTKQYPLKEGSKDILYIKNVGDHWDPYIINRFKGGKKTRKTRPKN